MRNNKARPSAKQSTHTSKPARHSKSASSSVRIIGGQFKRRQLAFIDAEGLRPTPDRLRETLFNWLMADLFEASVLDCCAGSGVLGFEAISRGAAHCTFIEANSKQSQQLHASAAQLQLTAAKVQIFTGQAEIILQQHAAQLSQFDIVFLDPPYDLDLWLPILNSLIDNNLLTEQTLVYIEANRAIEDILTAPELTSPYKFESLKQSKVGQIFAGLYQFSLAD